MSMDTPVTEDQFEMSDKGIKHLPTGYAFNVDSLEDPHSGKKRLGYHGSKLPSGEDYDPDEVDMMMKKLWADYVKKHGL
jgi:hypothetical protein